MFCANGLDNDFEVLIEVLQELVGHAEAAVGDAVMAVFGAPFPQPDHAGRALRAAAGLRHG